MKYFIVRYCCYSFSLYFCVGQLHVIKFESLIVRVGVVGGGGGGGGGLYKFININHCQPMGSEMPGSDDDSRYACFGEEGHSAPLTHDCSRRHS